MSQLFLVVSVRFLGIFSFFLANFVLFTIMERFEQMVRQIPPISRTWIALVLVVSGITTNDIVPHVKVVFIPSRIREEPWRIFTLFCYFGPLSLPLVLVLFQIRDSTSALEGGYINEESMLPARLTAGFDAELVEHLKTKFQENRMVDFAYFLFQIAVTILVAVTIVYRHFNFTGASLVFLGPILHNSLMYIWCKTYPESNLMLLQLPIRAKYAYWSVQLIYIVVSEDFLSVIGAYKHGFVTGLYVLLTSLIIVSQVVVVAVAHFWWFLRYFIVETMYNDTKTDTRRDWKRAYDSFAPGVSTRSVVRAIAQVVVTPPWYWMISKKFRGEQRVREIARELEGEGDVNSEAEMGEADEESGTGGQGMTVDGMEVAEQNGEEDVENVEEYAERSQS